MSATASAARQVDAPASAPAAGGRRGPRFLPVYFAVMLALLYLPIGILFVFSIQSNTTLS